MPTTVGVRQIPGAQMSLAGLLLAISGSFAAAQDDPGQVIFNNSCRTCHTVKEGDNRLGPTLAKVVGRKAGSLPDYAYSDAMKNSGIVWDEATLDRFIEDPNAVVAGNNMKPYTGMTNAGDRAAIVAYLKTQ
jgi:cytochrome c